MSHFSLLLDPDTYAVTDVDLLADAQAREYWVKLFDEHFAQVLDAARTAYGRTHARQIESARSAFQQALQPLRADPVGADGPLGVLQLCRMREQALRDHGLDDPFRHIKQREDNAALELYPEVVQQIGALEPEDRWERLFRGVFAGNLFDLGSAVTMGYARDQMDFQAEVESVKPRPWLVDDLEALLDVLPLAGGEPAPWAKAVVLVDNGGSDFVLGVMPWVRQLASHGTHIVLAANELPSLNDITVEEAIEIVEQLVAADDKLASYVNAGRFEVVSTGNDIPLIDLSAVSDELNEAAADADLVVLEGMGRSIESNLNTRFAVDAIQMCLLKDASVAARVDGEIFDCVCMYRPAEQADGE